MTVETKLIVSVGDKTVLMLKESEAEDLWRDLGTILFDLYVQRHGIDPDSEPF